MHRRNHAAVLALLALGAVLGSTQASSTGKRREIRPNTGEIADTYLANPHLGQLHLDGANNDFGVSVAGLILTGGTRLVPDMEDGALVGRDPDDPARTYRGDELTGSMLLLRQAVSGSRTIEWAIFVRRVEQHERLSDEYAHETVYRLTYAPLSNLSDEQYLCTGRPEAVLVAGEKYDLATLRVSPAPNPSRWLHVACHGDVLWTMKLASYDPARRPSDPYFTTPGQRQSTIMMLRGDYCGRGVRSVQARPAISARNRTGWATLHMAVYPGLSIRREAGWDAGGATCLDMPRTHDMHSRRDIEAACGRPIPRCTDAILAHSEWTTWTL